MLSRDGQVVISCNKVNKMTG